MKKKIIISIVSCIVVIGVIVLTYFGVKHNLVRRDHKILLDVLKNNAKLINENNEEILFKDYRIPGCVTTEANQYAFTDLDKDGIDELIAKTTSDYGAYIIIHYDKKGDGKIYGYMIEARSLENLKADGLFMGSNGADYSEYLSMSFDKNKKVIKAEA